VEIAVTLIIAIICTLGLLTLIVVRAIESYRRNPRIRDPKRFGNSSSDDNPDNITRVRRRTVKRAEKRCCSVHINFCLFVTFRGAFSYPVVFDRLVTIHPLNISKNCG